MNHYKTVTKVLWIIMFANLIVAVLKMLIGGWIKSASMSADGFHSLTDASSNIVGLIGIKYASKPMDEDHPYGHKKFETLAGLIIAGMLFFIAGKIIIEAFMRFINMIEMSVTPGSLIVLTVTLLINIMVSRYEYCRGKQLGSDILISDSIHTQSDIFVSLGVLFTLGAIKLGLPPVIDPVASVVVAGFILHAAYEIYQSASGVLVDKNALDIEEVRKIVMSFGDVKDAHDIRSRGRQDDIHIDLHIMTDPHMSIEESHTLIHSIEDKMKEELCENIQMIVHIEPYEQSTGSSI